MDKVRIVAALVVMMGHLLHTKSSSSGFLIGSHLEKILSSGSFAVVVFFGLSGIALRFQTDKYGICFRWLVARFIRLMPVYWITLIPPIVGCYLFKVRIEYPAFGFLAAALGLQAIANGLSIPPVNGPLWSLSVELYLSASLFLLGRWKKTSGICVLAGLVLLNLLVPGNAILQGLPIFYLGYLLPGIQHKFIHIRVLITSLFFFSILDLLTIPSSVQGRFQGFANFLVCNLLASIIVAWSLLSFSAKSTFFAELSQRSYSLYAVHAPIVLFIDKILFSGEQKTSAGQVFISILVIFFATEILYRFIEKPSIRFSREYLTKSAL